MILLITGPCAVGKTTIAKLISKQYGFKYIGGDDIKNQLFPTIVKIDDYPEKLEQVYLQLFNTVKENFDVHNNIVLDYILISQISKYQAEFGNQLVVRILLPSISQAISRDQSRSCWTAGFNTIAILYPKFELLKNTLKPECFIDTTNETPTQTINNHFSQFLHVTKTSTSPELA